MFGQRRSIRTHPFASRGGHGIPAQRVLSKQSGTLQSVDRQQAIGPIDTGDLQEEAQPVLQILKLGLAHQPSEVQLMLVGANKPRESLNDANVRLRSSKNRQQEIGNARLCRRLGNVSKFSFARRTVAATRFQSFSHFQQMRNRLPTERRLSVTNCAPLAAKGDSGRPMSP
jgi:hypothetical protein